MDVASTKAVLTGPQARRSLAPIGRTDWLSSGSTLLDLAASDSLRGTFAKGRYYIYVGDSGAGKTWLALSCLAEAANNKNFEGYRLLYDNSEDGALMEIERYFGRRVMSRLEPPRGTCGEPEYSYLTEELYYNLDDAISVGKPFIYVMDSLDALDTEYARKKFKARKKAARGNGKEAGDFGDGKAKINSSHIRRTLAGLRDTGSILVLISQTRDNIKAGPFDFGPDQVYAGGRALKFYAGLEIWTSVARQLRREVMGKKRQVGIVVKAHVTKNRITGRDTTVEIPILWSAGIDDIGGCVDFLTSEGYWKTNKSGQIKADEIKLIGHREQVIGKIEDGDMERDVRDLVSSLWEKIREACSVKRKSRYE